MNTGWIIPFIIIGGALQTCGAAMNGQLNKHLINPWLASVVSFAMITIFLSGHSSSCRTRYPQQRISNPCHGGLLSAVWSGRCRSTRA